MTMQPEEVVRFWCDTCGPDKWYAQEEELDAEIRARFGDAVLSAQQGGLADWEGTPQGSLALLILIDQFSRNIFRGSGQSFAGDARAREIARAAIAADHDLVIPYPERVFFYMPFVHSEDLADQDEGVRLEEERLGPEGSEYVLHAKVHREIIRRFGRFPYRNEALGRETSAAEREFLETGGYGAILRELQEG
ncbi:DUF924 family protein [Rhodobacterales bacterium HKCCE3408]|nr:DUF924 family protein [Rhodobacterales bacterium HKCCE3408]